MIPVPTPRVDVERIRGDLPPLLPVAALGPVVEITFPQPNMARDVPHGLGQVPDGYVVHLSCEGLVAATEVPSWTADIALMKATDANTVARLQFYTLLKGVSRNVVP